MVDALVVVVSARVETILFARFAGRMLTFSLGTLRVVRTSRGLPSWRVDLEALVPDNFMIQAALERTTMLLELVDGKGRNYEGLAWPVEVVVGGDTKSGPATFLGSGELKICR